MKVEFFTRLEEGGILLRVSVVRVDERGELCETIMDAVYNSDYGCEQVNIRTDKVDAILLMKIAKTLEPSAKEFLNRLRNQHQELRKKFKEVISDSEILKDFKVEV